MADICQWIACRLCLLALCLLAASQGQAADWLSGMQRINLAPHLQLLDARDLPPDRRDLESVIAEARLPWRNVDPSAIQQGLPPGLYWLRAQLHNASGQDRHLLLVNDEPAASSLSLYRLDGSGGAHLLYGPVGSRHPFAHLPKPHRKPMVELDLAAGESVTLLWAVRSERLLQMRPTLWEPLAFQRYDHDRSVLYGMLYGALAVMAIYNLFLAVSVRERSYLYYVLYLLTIGYLVAASEGHAQQYLWPHRAWPVQESYLLVHAASLFAFFQFSSHFLELRRRLARWHRALLALCSLSALLLAGGGLLEQAWATRSGIAGATLVYIGALAAAVQVRLQGVAAAGHYIIAIVSLVLGLLATNLATLGLLPHTAGMESYASVGASLMLVFFALALADRINQLREDNRRANTSIQRALEETRRIDAELQRVQQERQRLQRQWMQLREENQAKNDFLDTIGGQLRPPMDSILAATARLGDTDPNPVQTRCIGDIRRAAEGLVEQAGALQDYAAAESGLQHLDIAPFDLETLLDDLSSLYAPRARQQRINLVASIGDDVPRSLQGDGRKLRQVLLAILDHALPDSDDGDVLIRVRRIPRPAVNSVELCFEVIDSNPRALSDAQRQHLFAPFRPHDDATGRHGNLDLAVVRELVALMDGSIGVDVEPGSGHRYWFSARFFTRPGEQHGEDSRNAGERV